MPRHQLDFRWAFSCKHLVRRNHTEGFNLTELSLPIALVEGGKRKPYWPCRSASRSSLGRSLQAEIVRSRLSSCTQFSVLCLRVSISRPPSRCNGRCSFASSRVVRFGTVDDQSALSFSMRLPMVEKALLIGVDTYCNALMFVRHVPVCEAARAAQTVKAASPQPSAPL